MAVSRGNHIEVVSQRGCGFIDCLDVALQLWGAGEESDVAAVSHAISEWALVWVSVSGCLKPWLWQLALESLLLSEWRLGLVLRLPSHIQERRTDWPPGLEALEIAHAASAHENNVAAYRQAGSVYGCVDGHGRRIERAVHWDGRTASPGRRVNVIFCCPHVLAECVV